jgi:hypothetical protein
MRDYDSPHEGDHNHAGALCHDLAPMLGNQQVPLLPGLA